EVRPASTVAVSVLIDTSGNVLQAQAISGHPLLRQEAAEAACRARFPPALIDGARPPAFGGILTYESPR
ncbi:MAG TPA: energy transducer TonB, partial [Pyrinomonadaceae bacterium]|nr:energy transducer TonB [Pyrinomonadaceae bacterium]